MERIHRYEEVYEAIVDRWVERTSEKQEAYSVHLAGWEFV
jgi:hypothetical protein